MTLINSLNVQNLIKQALNEDIGTGDITTNSLVCPNQTLEAKFNAREDSILAGLSVAEAVFKILDKNIEFVSILKDGDKMKKGQEIAVVKGSAAAILTGERTALNFLQRMSAIATMTNKYQEEIKPYKAKIADTRKTCPNFRVFEKYSVRTGGGISHRAGLYDAVMIKDNHIEALGSITEAVNRARKNISFTTKIEVETENLKQVQEALDAGADIIMLDNMSVEEMKKAVESINGKAIVEASGTVSLETVNKIASSGVDIISTSAITAKAGIIDIGLDI